MKYFYLILQILGNKEARELIILLVEALKDGRLSREEQGELITAIKNMVHSAVKDGVI
jgi:hypothetical protein